MFKIGDRVRVSAAFAGIYPGVYEIVAEGETPDTWKIGVDPTGRENPDFADEHLIKAE